MSVVVKNNLKISRIRAEIGTLGPTFSANGSGVTSDVVSFHCGSLSGWFVLDTNPYLHLCDSYLVHVHVLYLELF